MKYYTNSIETCKVTKAIIIAGIAIKVPNFKNLLNGKLIPFLFNIESHIIPASAPTGVKYAPIFEPIMEAKSAPVKFVPTS